MHSLYGERRLMVLRKFCMLIIKDMNIDKNLMFDHTLFTQFRIPKLSGGDYHLHSPFFHGGKSLS